jgi:hypothetical protein
MRVSVNGRLLIAAGRETVALHLRHGLLPAVPPRPPAPCRAGREEKREPRPEAARFVRSDFQFRYATLDHRLGLGALDALPLPGVTPRGGLICRVGFPAGARVRSADMAPTAC